MELSHRRDDAELLQQTKGIRVFLPLNDLASNDAVDVDTRERHRFASRWDAPPRPLMRAVKGVTQHHFVSFRNQVLNREATW